MASAAQLKALLRSHLDGDEDQFFSVAMQVAAHEAKSGHGKLAVEIRELIDRAKRQRGVPSQELGKRPIPINRPRGELAGVLSVEYSKTRLGHMVLDEVLLSQIKRVIREQRKASEILSHGLRPRRKLLLMGPPGTGKTMTASVLACEIGLPLLQVRLDGLITKYMGETAAKLRQVFESTGRTRGIYFFDEFDAIGTRRSMGNDVGEVRRILNSFLQMIEQDASHSLIVAATNHPDILDRALFRRFDDVLRYELPTEDQVAMVLKSRLGGMAVPGVTWGALAAEARGLSYAEVARASDEALKEALMEGRQTLSEADILRTLTERREMANRLRP